MATPPILRKLLHKPRLSQRGPVPCGTVIEDIIDDDGDEGGYDDETTTGMSHSEA